MLTTFGSQLKSFAYAVDFIDEESFMDLRAIVLDYTHRVLEIDFTRQLILAEADGHDALMPYGLSTEGKFTTTKIRDDQGEIKTQAAYSFIHCLPLWIVNENPDTPNLSEADAPADLWHHSDNLPKYRYPRGEKLDVPIQTSILIPMKQFGNVIGVLNFETRERLEITAAAKSELKLIADAVSMLYGSMISHKKNKGRTAKAIAELNDALQMPLPKLTKPRIFLASSERASEDVVSLIKETITCNFSEQLQLVFWQDMSQSGNINVQLLEILGKCRYGICYLSEPLNAEENLYTDNINVIFESGMLHGRSEMGRKFPASWIPVREEKSDYPPFDLTSERMILIVRDENGEIIDKEALQKAIISHINGLIAH